MGDLERRKKRPQRRSRKAPEAAPPKPPGLPPWAPAAGACVGALVVGLILGRVTAGGAEPAAAPGDPTAQQDLADTTSPPTSSPSPPPSPPSSTSAPSPSPASSKVRTFPAYDQGTTFAPRPWSGGWGVASFYTPSDTDLEARLAELAAAIKSYDEGLGFPSSSERELRERAGRTLALLTRLDHNLAQLSLGASRRGIFPGVVQEVYSAAGAQALYGEDMQLMVSLGSLEPTDADLGRLIEGAAATHARILEDGYGFWD